MPDSPDVKLKLNRISKTKSSSKKYDTTKLKLPEYQQAFKLELQNKFANLQELDSEDMKTHWTAVKESYQKTAEATIGFHQKKSKPWISEESWRKVDERRNLKEKINSTKSERIKDKWRKEYEAADKKVKKSLWKDKRKWAIEQATEVERAARNGNLKGVYDVTRTLCGERRKTMDVVRAKDGKLLTSEKDVKARWQEHFKEILNRPAPEHTLTEGRNPPEMDTIRTDYIQQQEIKEVIQQMKHGKSGGSDDITVDLLKADLDSTAWVLEELLQ